MTKLVVYLLHFDAPVGRSKHYVGSTLEHQLRTRIKRHRAGTASALTAEAVRRGIGIHLAYVWPAVDRSTEREIKAKGRFRNACPYCRAADAGHPILPFQDAPKCAPGVSPLSWPRR